MCWHDPSWYSWWPTYTQDWWKKGGSYLLETFFTQMNGRFTCLVFSSLFCSTMEVFITCSAKFRRLHQQIVRFTHCPQEHGLQFCLHKFVKKTLFWTICFDLSLLANNYVTTFGKILVFKNPKNSFDFFDRASYMKYMDILFNSIIVKSMSLKPSK